MEHIWSTPPFDPAIFDALERAHTVRLDIARAALPDVSPATRVLVLHLLDYSRSHGQLEGAAAATQPRPTPDHAGGADAACAWADYRSQYGVADVKTAHKAFLAGWDAAHGADDAGPLR